MEDEVRKAEGARHTGPLTQSRKGSPRGVGAEEGHDLPYILVASLWLPGGRSPRGLGQIQGDQ